MMTRFSDYQFMTASGTWEGLVSRDDELLVV